MITTLKRGRTTWGYYMPKYSFLKYGIEAHIHIYIHGEEVGSMFLNGELRDGKLKSKDMKIVRQYVLENADELQTLWNEYQNSAY